MKKYTLIAFVLLIQSFSAFADDIIPQLATQQQEIVKVYGNWQNALASRKSQKIVQLYSNDAILLPTLSNKVINNQKERTDYFNALTKRKDLKVTPKQQYIKVYGNIATNTGLYDFSFKDEKNNTVVVPARYSFVYEKTKDGWIIVNHHSSKLPE